MSWRIDVRHTTEYRYAQEVMASYNEARLTPQSTADQVTVVSRLEVDPHARLFRYWDYWGTLVHAFDVHVPHDELIVTASSTVETPDAHADVDPGAIGWAALEDAAVADRYYEYLTPSRAVLLDEQLALVASELRAAAAAPGDAVTDVAGWVRAQLVYERGQTTVTTSALEAWRAGHGVCQDFVHLTLALLRSMRIPARYVSGYFYPESDAAIGETVVGESHAWAEAWLGDWYPFDPTNGGPVGHRHVLVGRGRHYDDVAPLKGIYNGAPAATPTVVAELTRRA
ncbi:MAG: transglutaminase protein [Acidimicrobiales bacterium]|nr:transglutaminase protein [Acidimicrobiales bacterium]